MSENGAEEIMGSEGQEGAAPQDAGQQGEKATPQQGTFTQEQVNSMVGKARTSEREKHAAEIEALNLKNKEASEELEALRAENAAMKEQRERESWVKQAASEAGVPASLLRGNSLEELQEHAEAVRKALVTAQAKNAPKYPVVNDSGKPKDAKMSKSDILSIQDKKARKRAILENLDLF